MKWLYRSHLWMSLSGGLLAAGFAHHLGYHPAWFLGIFVLACSIFVYNLQQPRLKKAGQEVLHRLVIALSGCGALTCVVMITLSHWYFGPLMALLFALAMWYQFPAFKKTPPLRNIPFIKIWLLALVWTLSCFGVPLMLVPGADFTALIFGYLYFLALSLLFDLRDAASDAPELKTIPQLTGRPLARMICLLMYGIFHAWLFQQVEGTQAALLLHAHGLYFAACIFFAGTKSTHQIRYMLMDGSMLLLGLVYFFS